MPLLSGGVDRLFRSSHHTLVKISVAGIVGLLLSIRVVWWNRGRFSVLAAVIAVITIMAVSMGVGTALIMADAVRTRVRAGEQVSFVSRLAFGYGIWSLLLWI